VNGGRLFTTVILSEGGGWGGVEGGVLVVSGERLFSSSSC